MCAIDDAVYLLQEKLLRQLDPETLRTQTRAMQWLNKLSPQPDGIEKLALCGFYLQQACGSKAVDLVVEVLQSQGVSSVNTGRVLGLITQLNEGYGCISARLEEAIGLAELEALDQKGNLSSIRQFLEQSRIYLTLSPASLRWFQQAKSAAGSISSFIQGLPDAALLGMAGAGINNDGINNAGMNSATRH
ncbi:hypothetical protein [Motiliproteus sp. MSK22-1]|uniref:hypothetical protein n=1 Tax=Motiliproteus sp. MSK22-1 TaxID=1897630 RepID=UPI000978B1DA|nr:hypothetical protein [Motiliproteus sp. MSK22-1]OMH25555.1 hypothetical protein BGP75_23635 [Motiliproteus sp. MSK22-1]